MGNIFKGFLGMLALTFLASNLFAQTPDQWPEEFVGAWKLTGAGGETRYIVLAKDTTAQTTFDAGAGGKWLYDPDQNEVRIQWSNEWSDVMVKEGAGYKNYGYNPKAEPGDPPTNSFQAEKIEIDPFDYLGVLDGMDVKGNAIRMTVLADNSAVNDSQGGQKGEWTIAGGKVQISWPDGSTDLIVKEGDQYKKSAYTSGASLEGEPSGVAIVKRVRKLD